jgi:hypothetical protein
LVDELGCRSIQIDKNGRGRSAAPSQACYSEGGQESGTSSCKRRLPTMPRYFFDIHHDTTHIDEQGEELADQHAAWKEATVMAGRRYKVSTAH